jgi:hypothetical protein
MDCPMAVLHVANTRHVRVWPKMRVVVADFANRSDAAPASDHYAWVEPDVTLAELTSVVLGQAQPEGAKFHDDEGEASDDTTSGDDDAPAAAAPDAAAATNPRVLCATLQATTLRPCRCSATRTLPTS